MITLREINITRAILRGDTFKAVGDSFGGRIWWDDALIPLNYRKVRDIVNKVLKEVRPSRLSVDNLTTKDLRHYERQWNELLETYISTNGVRK